MVNFSKQRVNTCVKFAKAFSYSLPIKITHNITQYLNPYAKETWPFKHTNMLRMDGKKFLINGMGDTHILTVTIRKDATQQDIDALDKSLDLYIDFQKGK